MDREIPFRFEVTNSASQILSEYSDLAEGDGSGVTVSVAGRLMLRRDQGKIVFGKGAKSLPLCCKKKSIFFLKNIKKIN